MLKSLFNKIACLKSCNFIRKKLQHCKIFKSACSKENLRTTTSVYLKSKLQIIQFTHKPKTFNFRIYKVFSYLFSFANFSSTKFIFAFASFLLTKHFQRFVLQQAKQIKRFESLSNICTHVHLYTKFRLYLVKLCSRDKISPQHH